MSEQTNPPTQTQPTPPPAMPAATKPREPKVGDTVSLVTCRDGNVPAEVTRVNKDGTVDLVAILRGDELVINKSPRDDAAKQPDSWHFPA